MTADAQLDYWAERIPDSTYVYVVQGDPDTPIKVGVAKDPKARLRGLQTGNPQVLRLLYVVPGDHKLETSFHRRLEDSAITGEWFGGEGANEFLGWIANYSRRAIRVYERTGQLPAAPPAPKEIRRRGFGPYPDRGGRLGHRWRTQDSEEPNPVTVRFVDPDPRRPSDEIAEKLQRAAEAGFDSYELEALQRELVERGKREAA